MKIYAGNLLRVTNRDLDKSGHFKTSYKITSIEQGVFRGLVALNSVEISLGLRQIGASAFEDCINLKSIIIPRGVNWIANDAFSRCMSLTTLDIPQGLIQIGSAFIDCKKLRLNSILCWLKSKHLIAL